MTILDLPTEVLATLLSQQITIKQQISACSVCPLFREAVILGLAQRECIATLHVGQLCVPGDNASVTLKQALMAYHARAEVALQWLIPRCPGLIDVKLNAGNPSARTHATTTTSPPATMTDLAATRGITDVTAQLLAKHCPHLRFLALRCPQLTDDGIVALAQNCQALVAVDLSRTAIAVSSLTALVKNCTELLHLNVSSTRMSNRAVVEAFSAVKTKLQSVDISDNPITDSCAETVAAACPELERINLSGGDTLETMDIGDMAVMSFTKQCVHLRHIDVSYSALTDAGQNFLIDWAAVGENRTFVFEKT